jgi:copper(I)-binding protein
MKNVLLSALAASLALLPSLALAGDYKLGALEIGQPWSRATPPTAPTAGGFLTITNAGATPDRLVAARTTAAEQAQVHQMKMEGNVMRMRELDHGLDVPAGATVALTPGGYHLMLIGLKAPLKTGMRVPVTLVFEKAGSIDVELDVQAMGSTAPAHGR